MKSSAGNVTIRETNMLAIAGPTANPLKPTALVSRLCVSPA